MKRVLMLLSNPRPGGMTQIVAEALLAGLNEGGFHADCVNLCKSDIKPCLGCYSCIANSRCVHKDDMREILRIFTLADAVICVSPVYFYSVSSRMREFFERCFPLVGGERFMRCGKADTQVSPKPQKSLFAVSVAAGIDAALCANIEQMYEAVSKSLGLNFAGSVLRMESMYLKYPTLNPQKIGAIKDALAKAAKELAAYGRVCGSTKEAISARISKDDAEFEHHARLFWQKMRK